MTRYDDYHFRLLSRISFAKGCWKWLGHKHNEGYGLIKKGNKSYRVHRIMYELLVGTIPAGMELDHLCRNTSCVNPKHMEVVTGRENILRSECPPAKNARKTTCLRGHLFSEDNIYKLKDGSRACKTCDKMRHRARQNAGLK